MGDDPTSAAHTVLYIEGLIALGRWIVIGLGFSELVERPLRRPARVSG